MCANNFSIAPASLEVSILVRFPCSTTTIIAMSKTNTEALAPRDNRIVEQRRSRAVAAHDNHIQFVEQRMSEFLLPAIIASSNNGGQGFCCSQLCHCHSTNARSIAARNDRIFELFAARDYRIFELFAARDYRIFELFATRDYRIFELFAARDYRIFEIIAARDYRIIE